METQIKQRVVGVIVLLILVGAITALLFYGAKQGEKVATDSKVVATESAVDNKDVQLVLHSEGQAGDQQPAVPATTADAGESVALPVAGTAVNPNQKSQIFRTPRDVVNNNASASTKPIANNFGQLASAPAPKNDLRREAARPKKVTSEVTDVAANAPSATSAADMLTNDTTTSGQVKEPAKKVQPAAAPAEPVEEQQPVAAAPKPVKAYVAPQKVYAKVAKSIKAPKIIKVAKKTTPVLPVSSGWSVKLGSFISPDTAADLVKKLKAAGHHAYTGLLVTDHGVFTQVFIGPFSDQNQAKHEIANVNKKFHTQGIVIKNKK